MADPMFAGNLSEEIRDLVDQDFPPIGPITAEAVNEAMELSHRFRGSVRMALGRVWTDEDYESYRERILNIPFP